MAENNKKLCDLRIELDPLGVLAVLAHECYGKRPERANVFWSGAIAEIIGHHMDEKGMVHILPEDIPTAFAKTFSAWLIGSCDAVEFFAARPRPIKDPDALEKYASDLPEAVASDKSAVLFVLFLAKGEGVNKEVICSKIRDDFRARYDWGSVTAVPPDYQVEQLVDAVELAVTHAHTMEENDLLLRRLG